MLFIITSFWSNDKLTRVIFSFIINRRGIVLRNILLESNCLRRQWATNLTILEKDHLRCGHGWPLCVVSFRQWAWVLFSVSFSLQIQQFFNDCVNFEGWTSPGLPSMGNSGSQPHLVDSEEDEFVKSWIGSSTTLGALAGGLLAGLFSLQYCWEL